MTGLSWPVWSVGTSGKQAQRLMESGATLCDPARVDVRGDVSVGRDVMVDVNVVFEGRVDIGDGVRIGPNTVIRDSIIGANTEVLSHCLIEEAQTGAGCRIGPYARLRPGNGPGRTSSHR